MANVSGTLLKEKSENADFSRTHGKENGIKLFVSQPADSRI